MSESAPRKHPEIRPGHIMAGLGSADRDLLSTSLALFDDSTVKKRLARLYEQVSERARELTGSELENAERELRSSQDAWKRSRWDDNELRLILWARLRESIGLPPRMSGSLRGCSSLAEDLAARLIHFLDPPSLKKSGKRWLRQKGWLEGEEQAVSLGDIVLPLLDELLANSPAANEFPSDPVRRREALSAAVAALSQLTKQEQEQLLKELKVDKVNDAALLKILAVGGGLGTFGAGVGAAGFSAYILAAQASAFVPFVSGPGLVSFVAVLSNPITILAAASGGAWWFLRSARQRVNANITARIVAMLTIQGLQSGPRSIVSIRECFSEVGRLRKNLPISNKMFSGLKDEWALIESTFQSADFPPSESVMDVMERPVGFKNVDVGVRPSKGVEGNTGSEVRNAAALATMTVGDVLYSLAAIDPLVIEAADFSRIANIDGRIEFSVLAQELLEGSTESIQGGASQLKGYVAEHVVASELAAAGHSVEFPEHSNSPGWDLRVDGQPFQIKFQDSVQGVERHFDKYDYPVIANTELKGHIPEEFEDRVFFVEGVSDELVEQVSQRSLEAGHDAMTPGSPAFVSLISAARGWAAYRGGNVTARQALEQVMLDGTVRVGLFGAGGVLGATTGMLLFGPAGAWVLGAGVPILAQMQTPGVSRYLKSKLKGEAHKSWEAHAHRAIDGLIIKAQGALNSRCEAFETKLNRSLQNPAGRYVRWRMCDDYCFSQEGKARFSIATSMSWSIPEQRAGEVFRLLTTFGVHPAIYQDEMHSVTTAISGRPGLSEIIDKDEVARAWEKYSERTRRAAGMLGEKINETEWAEKTKNKIGKARMWWRNKT